MFSVQNLMIDEADEAMPGQQSSRKRSAAESPSSPRPNKRKPGKFNDEHLYHVELLSGTVRCSVCAYVSLKYCCMNQKCGL